MRVAIFADIHGNLAALEAEWQDIKQQGSFDLIVCAGDLCLYGPRPEECLQFIRAHEDEIICIYGDTDQWIDGPPLLSRDIEAEEAQRRRHIRNLVEWTRERLSESDRAWLRELPFRCRHSPTVNPRDDLLIVHANPKNVRQPIYPPPAEQKALFGSVRQTDADLSRLLGNLIAEVVVFGHLHATFVRRWRQFKLVNTGALSLPADEDARARYAILDWNPAGEEWQVTIRAIEYDVASEIEAFRRNCPPGWQEAVENLNIHGFIPQNDSLK